MSITIDNPICSASQQLLGGLKATVASSCSSLAGDCIRAAAAVRTPCGAISIVLWTGSGIYVLRCVGDVVHTVRSVTRCARLVQQPVPSAAQQPPDLVIKAVKTGSRSLAHLFTAVVLGGCAYAASKLPELILSACSGVDSLAIAVNATVLGTCSGAPLTGVINISSLFG